LINRGKKIKKRQKSRILRVSNSNRQILKMDWYTINRLGHHHPQHPHHPPIKMTLTYFVGQREATFSLVLSREI
jgi:hypothetical protein